MAQVKHTPGQWYKAGELKNQVKSNIRPHGVLIANVNPLNEFLKEEAEANATLLSAAPALYETLQELLIDLNSGNIQVARDRIKIVLNRNGLELYPS